jgi:glycine hydroxymethyltransferase
MVPFDKQKPFVTGGIRVGSAAVTTRGMKQDEMVKIAALIDKALQSPGDESALKQVGAEVRELAQAFPLYPQAFEY